MEPGRLDRGSQIHGGDRTDRDCDDRGFPDGDLRADMGIDHIRPGAIYDANNRRHLVFPLHVTSRYCIRSTSVASYAEAEENR